MLGVKFILFCYVVVSCYSYSYSKPLHIEPEMPPEFMEPEKVPGFIYPQEYIDKLFAGLSPEEQKNLTSTIIDIGDRDADTGPRNCSFTERVFPPHLQIAVEDKLEYLVVQKIDFIQTYIVQDCTKNNKMYNCKNVKFTEGQGGCCKTKAEEIIMKVAATPYRELRKREATTGNMYDSNDNIVFKRMYLNTLCICQTQDLVNEELGTQLECTYT